MCAQPIPFRCLPARRGRSVLALASLAWDNQVPLWRLHKLLCLHGGGFKDLFQTSRFWAFHKPAPMGLVVPSRTGPRVQLMGSATALLLPRNSIISYSSRGLAQQFLVGGKPAFQMTVLLFWQLISAYRKQLLLECIHFLFSFVLKI